MGVRLRNVIQATCHFAYAVAMHALNSENMVFSQMVFQGRGGKRILNFDNGVVEFHLILFYAAVRTDLHL